MFGYSLSKLWCPLALFFVILTLPADRECVVIITFLSEWKEKARMPTRSLWSFATQRGAWTPNIQPYSIFTCRNVRVVDCGDVHTNTLSRRTHASRRRKSLFNAPQGSTWDKIQQLWIIQSIYQRKNANPDMRTHTHAYIYIHTALWEACCEVKVPLCPWSFIRMCNSKCHGRRSPMVWTCLNFFSLLWTLTHVMQHCCTPVM